MAGVQGLSSGLFYSHLFSTPQHSPYLELTPGHRHSLIHWTRGSRGHTKKCGLKISKPSASLDELHSQSQLRRKRPQWRMRLCSLQFFIGISHLRSIQALSQVCLTFGRGGRGGCAMQYEPPLARVEIASTWRVSQLSGGWDSVDGGS